MDISVVVPLYNEEESLPELCAWIKRVMDENNFSYEVILVDDGSKDTSWKVIESLSAANSFIKGIKFRRNYGKSAALNTGFEVAMGDVVITMDADLQDSPDEIPGLYKMVTEEGYDVVSGWKRKRYDPITKTLPTKLFNWAARKVSGIKLHDFNCGLKAYKGQVTRSIEVYGEMHRYIPIIAKWNGFDKIGEKVVIHQARKYGTTKFGMNRFVNGFLDLLSIGFVSKFSKKPMHFFGTMGLLCFILGGFIAVWLLVAKIIHIYSGTTVFRDVTDQPLFYLALVAMVIGSQMFIAGYIAEMISRSAPDKNKYLVDSRINHTSNNANE